MSLAYYQQLMNRSSEPFADYTNKLFWFDPQSNVTTSGSNLAAWGDRFGVATNNILPYNNAPDFGSNTANGVPLLTFDRSNVESVRLIRSSDWASINAFKTNFTIYIVLQMDANTGFQTPLIIQNPATTTIYSFAVETNGGASIGTFMDLNGSGVSGTEIDTSRFSISLTLRLWSLVFNDTDIDYYLNGAYQATYSYGPTNLRIINNQDLFLGARGESGGILHCSMKMGDVLAFNETHDSTKITEVNNYLLNKYNL